MLTTLGLWEFVTGPAAMAVLAVTLIAAWPVGKRIARRLHSPRSAAVLYVIAVGVVLALTLTPNEPVGGVHPVMPPHYLAQVNDPAFVWSTLTAAPSDAEQWANVALYVPIGLIGRFVCRTAARAVLAGTALTMLVETCQYGIVGRAGSFTDMRNNTAGTILGALVAAGAAYLLTRASRRPGRHVRQ